MRLGSLCMLVVFAACGEGPVEPDAGPVDAGQHDAGTHDAGTHDAGTHDAGINDAGTVDSGMPDAGHLQDAGPLVDAGIDAGFDAGSPDSGTPDSGSTDAGAHDAGVRDAGGFPPFDAGDCPGPSDAGDPFILRAMASNLSSGNLQSYDPGPGIRIIQGLNPDVVMMQEMNYGANDAAAMATFMRTLDAGYTYFRGTGQIPNGVLSRYVIADAGEWTDPRVSNRAFAWANIDLPGPRDLWVVSVHLLTSGASERNLEAKALIDFLSANVPPTDFLIIAGDFNTDTVDEAALATLSDRVRDALPAPTDQSGNPGTSANRNKPYDHVLTSACLMPLQVDAGLVFDSRVFMPLSAVPPVLQSDSAAPSMQHMGVVKDFLIIP